MGGEIRNVVKHTVGDHLFTFRNCFVFFNSIGHYFNIIYVRSVRAGQPMVSVQGSGLPDVTIELAYQIRAPVMVWPQINETV